MSENCPRRDICRRTAWPGNPRPEPGQESAFGRSANALSTKDPVLRNRPPKNIVDEFHARAARRRLHADAAHAELPVPAGLFLVLALGVGLAANCLAEAPWAA